MLAKNDPSKTIYKIDRKEVQHTETINVHCAGANSQVELILYANVEIITLIVPKDGFRSITVSNLQSIKVVAPSEKVKECLILIIELVAPVIPVGPVLQPDEKSFAHIIIVSTCQNSLYCIFLCSLLVFSDGNKQKISWARAIERQPKFAKAGLLKRCSAIHPVGTSSKKIWTQLR